MKVLMINGSPRVSGCTNYALRCAGEELEAAGVEVELLQIGNKAISGCTACGACKKSQRCIIDDMANVVIDKLEHSDALIVGSPVYFSSPNASLLALLDRVFYSANRNFAYKPGAAIVSARRGGSSASLEVLWKYFTIAQMPVVSSSYWPMVHGNNVDEVKQDLEGIQVMRVLGRNMAWMLQSIKAGRDSGVVLPQPVERVHTNFIR